MKKRLDYVLCHKKPNRRVDEEVFDEDNSRGQVSADYPSSKPDFASRRAEQTVTAPDQFKSYEDLKKRLNYVLGAKPPTRRVFDEELEDESEGRGSFTPDFKTNKSEPVASASADEDDALSYFQKLAEE